MKQLILCVETSKKANTDGLYISKALKTLYRIDNNIKITYIYCEGKTKYASKLKEIKEAKLKIKDSNVIYLFDTDAFDVDIKHQSLNNEIVKFCKENEFDYIWFCRDIEEVFLHHSVPNNSKIKEASKFSNSDGISETIIESLASEKQIRYKSNFIFILDKYLDRNK